MVAPDRPPKNNINRLARKVYNAIGFTRFYNFVLWFIFSGAMLGFVLARAPFMNFSGVFCSPTPGPSLGAAPGECLVYYSRKIYKIGIIMHLCTILPAGFLVLFQFVPVIRHKLILFHRLNGYVVITLILLSNAAALMIARPAFGGTLDTQLGIGFLVIATTVSVFLAWVNIKRLQIDQHRKWMLRAWFYFASIITERLIQRIAFDIITTMGSYYYAMPCKQIIGVMVTFGMPPEMALDMYPNCLSAVNGTGADTHVAIHASMNGTPEQITAVLDITFGMSLWTAIVLHAVGIELYLYLTPRESERLRQVSYERQVEAGMTHPGSAGLTADRLGDANPFVPLEKERRGNGHSADIFKPEAGN